MFLSLNWCSLLTLIFDNCLTYYRQRASLLQTQAVMSLTLRSKAWLVTSITGGQLPITNFIHCLWTCCLPKADQTSQPSLNAFCAAMAGSDRDPGIDHLTLQPLVRYWAKIREMYRPFESGMLSGMSFICRWLRCPTIESRTNRTDLTKSRHGTRV